MEITLWVVGPTTYLRVSPHGTFQCPTSQVEKFLREGRGEELRARAEARVRPVYEADEIPIDIQSIPTFALVVMAVDLSRQSV